MKNITALLLILFLLSGCASSTRINSSEGTASVKINNDKLISTSENTIRMYNSTTFGSYKFVARKNDTELMYGTLPMQVHPTRVISDIFFFAPALFLNLRDVYPYYEIDINNKSVKYKKHKDDKWEIYKPTKKQIKEVSAYFNNQ